MSNPNLKNILPVAGSIMDRRRSLTPKTRTCEYVALQSQRDSPDLIKDLAVSLGNLAQESSQVVEEKSRVTTKEMSQCCTTGFKMEEEATS